MGRKKPDVENLYGNDIDLSNKTIWLMLGKKDSEEDPSIDYQNMERFVKNIHLVNQQPVNDVPVTIYLTTIGGDEHAGSGLMDAIAMCKHVVKIIGIGSIYSMGAVVMQSADIRCMTPWATFMTHDGDQVHEGHKKIVEKWVNYTKKFDKRLDDFVFARINESNAEHGRKLVTRKQYERMNFFDTILNAEEALELGFIDQIIDPEVDKL